VAEVELGELRSAFLPDPVPFAVLAPRPGGAPLPLCVVLFGGGGSRQSLVDCQPLFEAWWAEGSLPPMVLASPSGGMSYYLEHPAGGIRWDAFLAEAFLDHLRATHAVGGDRASTAIIGLSMGGYGALKIAFARPDRFAAVAAMGAVLEPGLHDEEVTARNRLHHGSGGPAALVGPARDPAVVDANRPAARAVAHAASIRDHDLAIYLEVGSRDVINAHDGTEFLHRVLWDLDIAHEYRLARDADHVGPTLVPRMRDAFVWLGATLTRHPESESPAVTEWIAGGMVGAPPAVSPSSADAVRIIRAQLDGRRRQATADDPTTLRLYGILPGTSRCRPAPT
jgi:S-formylglutathione hydrolase